MGFYGVFYLNDEERILSCQLWYNYRQVGKKNLVEWSQIQWSMVLGESFNCVLEFVYCFYFFGFGEKWVVLNIFFVQKLFVKFVRIGGVGVGFGVEVYFDFLGFGDFFDFFCLWEVCFLF